LLKIIWFTCSSSNKSISNWTSLVRCYYRLINEYFCLTRDSRVLLIFFLITAHRSFIIFSISRFSQDPVRGCASIKPPVLPFHSNAPGIAVK